MPVRTLNLDGEWRLLDNAHQPGYAEVMRLPGEALEEWMVARVPGDIHEALMDAGRIADPGIGLNAQDCAWTRYRDWWYRQTVMLPEDFGGECIELVFDGLDTFATIFINGQFAGAADNMFRPWRFDVTALLRRDGENEILVCIKGPSAILESRDTSRYFACFYGPRVVARKAQCHFSWDWAPNLPAIGIWRGVRLEALSEGRIENVHIRARADGEVLVMVRTDQYGKANTFGDLLEVTLSRGRKTWRMAAPVDGAANTLRLVLANPKLWWPRGYGKQPLYGCRVDYVRDGQVLDTWSGRFGIREVRLEESVQDGGRATFGFRVNGVKIFCQGANWVPADYLPARVTPARYAHLLGLCAEAGFNTLRVWGGGIYEADVFYEICDELGICVWQDLMFACADIPDDDPHFVALLIPEFEYQARRLRNHPCLLHWCGGNEKTGTFGAMAAYGDLVTQYVARGVLAHLCPDHSYTPCSPYAITDIGNDPRSGDTHTGNPFEAVYPGQVTAFRQTLWNTITAFNAEFGVNGPCCLRSLRKFIPAGRIWPVNEVWEAHVQDNPYNGQPDTFVQMQQGIVEALFRPAHSAADFIKLAGTVQAEVLGEAMRFQRRRFPHNHGALIWMFNDTWPAASWALVDYYGMPKQAWYAAKRASAPVILSFEPDGDGWNVVITNPTLEKVRGVLRVDVRHVSGGIFHQQSDKVKAPAQASVVGAVLPIRVAPADVNTYFHAWVEMESDDGGGGEVRLVWFPQLWKDIGWVDPEIEMHTQAMETAETGVHRVAITLSSRNFARCVYLHADEDIPVWFSDNYFDLPPGCTRTVILYSHQPVDPGTIRLDHWLTEWEV